MKVGVTECNGLIDDQHINPGALETNTHSGLMHSNGSVINNSSGTFSRNVGLITHVSLFTSMCNQVEEHMSNVYFAWGYLWNKYADILLIFLIVFLIY